MTGIQYGAISTPLDKFVKTNQIKSHIEKYATHRQASTTQDVCENSICCA